MENPQQLKLAKVTPIYENKGSAVITDQYRAQLIAEEVKQIMQKQPKAHLHKYNFITVGEPTRSNHSTETPLHKVIIDVLEGVNEGLV